MTVSGLFLLSHVCYNFCVYLLSHEAVGGAKYAKNVMWCITILYSRLVNRSSFYVKISEHQNLIGLALCAKLNLLKESFVLAYSVSFSSTLFSGI